MHLRIKNLLSLTQPELPVKITESDLVVLPAPHEVLPRLDVVADLEDHPAAALRLEVAEDAPRALGEVGRVDQVDAGAGGALRGLDVVAGAADLVGA